MDTEGFIGALPYNGKVVVTCKNGSIIAARIVEDNEHIASLNVLIFLAKSAGYSIVRPDGNAL
ncbi:TPA: hypothetical protein F6U86_001438 [Serratia marcescens]|nr:hypothetical protein [Serratia marcescens]